jgi:NAD(P)-dependent dehydrogenase (short-subunit alcohol dehydrogenase family)
MVSDEHALESALAGTHWPLEGNRLRGRVALISGAGSSGPLPGIGAATAVLFAAQGAAVTVVDRDADRASNTLRLIERVGGRGCVVTADITSLQACRDIVRQCLEKFGRLDILVNNAAVALPDSIRSISEEDIDVSLALNLKAPMFLSQAASVPLGEHRGAIVNIGSIAGNRGFGLPAYAATKAALAGLTRDMAVTLGSTGIRVNCVVPGAVNTPMGGRNEQARETVRRNTLIGVEGTAWDIAFAALFLASDEARWITGIDLVVDAGMTIAGRVPTLTAESVSPPPSKA